MKKLVGIIAIFGAVILLLAFASIAGNQPYTAKFGVLGLTLLFIAGAIYLMDILTNTDD